VTRFGVVGFWGALLLAAFAVGCGQKSNAQTIDSQTNWLRSCQIDSQCDEYACVCGVCTTPCTEQSACAGHEVASCVDANEPGAIAQCGGFTSVRFEGMCLPRCDATTPCPTVEGRKNMCVAGVCTPVPDAGAEVSVDLTAERQTLTGFGATIAYGEDQLTRHPQKAALFDAVFAELGLDVVRLRNRYGHPGDDDLSITADLLSSASASLGRPPTVILTSWSPPATIKANGSVRCSGNPDTCMLSKTPSGTFDYAGFASFWRTSLEAYADVGVSPDYIGIQNNPNWVPSSAESGEACMFLPIEGTTNVPIAGVPTTIEYPGFVEAQTATILALEGLSPMPRILAPETSDAGSLEAYVEALDLSQVDALSHHLYGMDPEAIDLDALVALGQLATENDRPIFQTEMTADGLGTAMLIHYTTVVEGASAYIQTALNGAMTGPTVNSQSLIGVDEANYTLYGPYYAIRHFALHTDPGWARVDAEVTDENLLVSAWRSLTGDAVTLVLVNPGSLGVDAKLVIPELESMTSSITRTVFGGLERGASLGALSPEGVLRVPARAVVTVAFSE
jgi:glucuronoarabinoxylan endo-1,4-beta-xylanase